MFVFRTPIRVVYASRVKSSRQWDTLSQSGTSDHFMGNYCFFSFFFLLRGLFPILPNRIIEFCKRIFTLRDNTSFILSLNANKVIISAVGIDRITPPRCRAVWQREMPESGRGKQKECSDIVLFFNQLLRPRTAPTPPPFPFSLHYTSKLNSFIDTSQCTVLAWLF